MKKILVVGSRHNQPGEEENLNRYEEFFQAAASKNVQVSHALLDDLIFDISPHKFSIYDSANKHELSEYQLIILRGKLRNELDLVFAISHYAFINKVKFFNDYRNPRSISKLAQAVFFYTEIMAFPRTIYASKAQINKLISKGALPLPFIYKSKLGAHGEDNFLIRSLDQLRKVKSNGMIAQRYIPNDGDYRILIVGDEHLIIRRRASAGSHLNNTSKGGSAELVENFDDSIINDAMKLAKKANMVAAGVDVIVDQEDGSHYFLEINSQPQLMSGAFLAEKRKMTSKLLSALLGE